MAALSHAFTLFFVSFLTPYSIILIVTQDRIRKDFFMMRSCSMSFVSAHRAWQTVGCARHLVESHEKNSSWARKKKSPRRLIVNNLEEHTIPTCTVRSEAQSHGPWSLEIFSGQRGPSRRDHGGHDSLPCWSISVVHVVIFLDRTE